MTRDATAIDNYTEDGEANDCQYLDDGEDKFSLAITANSEEVDQDDEHPKDYDPGSWIDTLSSMPKLKSNCSCSDLEGQCDEPLQGIAWAGQRFNAQARQSELTSNP